MCILIKGKIYLNKSSLKLNEIFKINLHRVCSIYVEFPT